MLCFSSIVFKVVAASTCSGFKKCCSLMEKSIILSWWVNNTYYIESRGHEHSCKHYSVHSVQWPGVLVIVLEIIWHLTQIECDDGTWTYDNHTTSPVLKKCATLPCGTFLLCHVGVPLLTYLSRKRVSSIFLLGKTTTYQSLLSVR